MDINIEPNYCFCKGMDVVFWERKAFIRLFFVSLPSRLFLSLPLPPPSPLPPILNNFLSQNSSLAALEPFERNGKEHLDIPVLLTVPCLFYPRKKLVASKCTDFFQDAETAIQLVSKQILRNWERDNTGKDECPAQSYC